MEDCKHLSKKIFETGMPVYYCNINSNNGKEYALVIKRTFEAQYPQHTYLINGECVYCMRDCSMKDCPCYECIR